MAKLLEPGPLPDKVLGKADAPVTIVEYASMTCPHCAHFHATTLPELKTKYIDTGKARLIFREFPFDPRAEAGFHACALLERQLFPDGRRAVQAAAELGVGGKRQGRAAANLQACRFFTGVLRGLLDGPETSGRCESGAESEATEEFKVDSTPTFFINGNTYKGALTIAEMSAIIDGML